VMQVLQERTRRGEAFSRAAAAVGARTAGDVISEAEKDFTSQVLCWVRGRRLEP
jgi:hypothetical protein